ncbi:MAG: hypothetical protein PHR35_20445 [Kiritimatiellae bacterium]|nr:hypothetical protein [Kiritimatiellia bacterium]
MTACDSIDIETRVEATRDPIIREAVRQAVRQTLLPAATEKAYPGHFTVVADGSHFGAENTWPGLDSWELAGAYLLLGKVRLVRDYLAFVRASQRADGNVPFAIFPADKDPGRTTYLRGLHWPEDIYAYTPPGGAPRKWIGLFDHWQTQANPLSVLGPASYVLACAEYYAATQDLAWLRRNLVTVEQASRYLLSRRDDNGLIGASGFYLECPPRNRWDGITQCFTVKVFQDTAALAVAAQCLEAATFWEREASALAEKVRREFWRDTHFAEYIHIARGLVDSHGLSDVNWAAIAFGVATDAQCQTLWPLLVKEPAFWQGGMPTQLVTGPGTYADWELPESLPFPIHNPLHDAAAMGRVWWLEAQACLRMGDLDRLRESVRLVCARGLRDGGWWFERYHMQPGGSVKPAGPKGYCEYAAILARIVFGHPELFS